jgi:hypothetical protein
LGRYFYLCALAPWRDKILWPFYFGSSGFTLKEYSPQRGNAATKMTKVGFTTKAPFD